MIRIFSIIRDKHNEIYRALLFIACVGAIVYTFPKEPKFKYDLSNLRGKPWPYENLIAQFDFAINKSTGQLAKEKTEVIRSSKLYFRYNPEVFKQKEEFVLSKLKSLLKNNRSDSSLYACKALLDTLYARGIIEITDAIENKPEDFTILLINKRNFEEERALKSFFTIKEADNYIQSHIKFMDNRQQLLNLLEDAITHNVFFDRETTNKVIKQNLDDISLTEGGRVKGQSIIMQGEIITPEKYEVLQSLKVEYMEQTGGGATYWFVLLGQVLAVTLLLGLLVVFLFLFRRHVIEDSTRFGFILLFVFLIVMMAAVTLRYSLASIYVLPFCILPIIIRAFYDTRIALYTHLVTMLIISLLLTDRYEFLFVELTAGMVSIFSMVGLRRRSQLFVASSIIFLVYCLSIVALLLIQDISLGEFSTDRLFAFALSSALTLFSYPLIYLFEKSFGFVSDLSLLELTDTNSNLLRELATKAPGTFQHSLQVADLAEEVIHAIGGNVLLIRAGALYHDIGKTDMPMYFIENQVTGYNPHEELDFEESANIIISHVIRGIEKAKKNNIPEHIIDFIRSHHGTTTTNFFYHQYKQLHPEGEHTEKDFQYPGPIPFSKETAVLMMADSVEASARSLKKHDTVLLSNLVESIIDNQIKQNQFINSDITFRDINQIKKIFKKKLANIYHSRIEYPK
jgi:cyclic-di-AMP phosphodiesterase PgpH